VRLINICAAILLLLAAIAVYWYAFRPLPKTSGEIAAPVSAPAAIKRDARGIPHIEASSWQDAIFLQGFVTAQDRLWQMDVLRRLGAGDLAEVFGSGALGADEESRRMRMRAIAENAMLHLRPEDRAVLVAYAQGVNYYIRQHRGNYPLEFSLPGHAYDPRDWTITDSIIIGLVMFRDMTDTSKFELAKGQLFAHATDAGKAHVLFPAEHGVYIAPGSNAWAVSGTHSVDGKPLVANDPHLTYGIPPTWYLVHLKAPGLDVSGASLPGVPSVITGHNDQIAWGVTNAQADVMDLYAEKLDPRTGRYLFKGAVEQAQLDREVIGVRDAKPVVLDTWVTRHGPIISQQNGTSYAMRWSAADGFALTFFDVDRARNWDEFCAAVHDFQGPGQNFVYADRAGNIGYHLTGRFPIRKGFEGDEPLDGSSGNFEWGPYISFEQLPSFFNPPSGLIATANQNPFPPDFPYRVPGNYHDRFRIEQIYARLHAKPKFGVEDMLAIQKDVYSAYDKFLADEVVAASGRNATKDELVRQAIPILKSWNGQMEKSEAAPLITETLSSHLARALVHAILPPNKREGMDILPRPDVIQDLLEKRPRGWVPHDDWDAFLLSNLREALADGRKQQGGRVRNWRWGRLLQWKFAHPVGKSLPVVDGYFDIGPVEMSGSGTTVKQTTDTLGPSERMVADLSDWDKSVQNLTTGESGNVASRHYKDEWPAYYVGRSFPMEFDRVEAKDVLTVRPER
jgi:penicillin amidase